jgi:hypothetical protein
MWRGQRNEERGVINPGKISVMRRRDRSSSCNHVALTPLRFSAAHQRCVAAAPLREEK